MSYRYLLTSLGAALIALGLVGGGWFLLVCWLGGNFLVLGLAHWRGCHRLFGKRPDGSLPLWSRLVFFPLLLFTTALWHLVRLLSPEPAKSIVTPRLVVGRRLLASELDEEFDNYIDLTAEFTEPPEIRQSPAYRSFPILDGAAPTPEALATAMAALHPGRTYIHCRPGPRQDRTIRPRSAARHRRGATVEEGLGLLTAARPGIRLNAQQLRCIRAYACKSSHI